MNNSIHINLTTQTQWTNSSKNTYYHKLTQYEIDNFASPINIKEIEFVILNLPKKEFPGLHDFLGEVYQRRINPNCILPLSVNRRGRNASKLSYEANIILITKPERGSLKKITRK